MKTKHLSSRICHLGSKNSFTLMEIMIVISLIVLLAITALVILNPWGQINKANDGKRKAELSSLKKVLEDWYNDKSCYPKPLEICYDSPANNTCHICGTNTNSPSFSPYLSRLPCDPQQPTKKYLYQFDNEDCPSWYRIYDNLLNNSDPVIAEVGCSDGCGPNNNYVYNYGVSSPNVGLEAASAPIATPTPGNYYCQDYNNCTFYNKDLWTCTPNYPDPNCGETNLCATIKSSCVKK